MAIGHEDQGGVTVPIAAFVGDPHKRFDLCGGQVLPRAQFAIAGACRTGAAFALTGLGCLAAPTVDAQSLAYRPVVHTD